MINRIMMNRIPKIMGGSFNIYNILNNPIRNPIRNPIKIANRSEEMRSFISS